MVSLSKIKQKLENSGIVDAEIYDDSASHSGHIGNPGKGITHVRIVVNRNNFVEKNTLIIHRTIYAILAEELQRIHSLSITFQE